MKVIRSWPLNPPSDRACVDDAFEKFYMENYDATRLVNYNDDIVYLEWDIAVSPEDLDLFVKRALLTPTHPYVAAYRLYPVSTGLSGPIWPHQAITGLANKPLRWIDTGEVLCDWFSLGIAYLPKSLIAGYVANPIWHDKRLTDTNLSLWHFNATHNRVRVDWDVRPVHLHY